MNKTKFLLLILMLVTAASYGQKSNKQLAKLQLAWISFIWEDDSLAGRYFDKAGISIPIQIDDLPYNFTAQLDLGAVHTVFYGKSLAPYLKMFPALEDKLDTALIQGYVGYDACRV